MVFAGLAAGIVLSPAGAWAASATLDCDTGGAALTAAALRADSGASAELQAAAGDGLTSDEAASLGFGVECRSGSVFFVAVSATPAPTVTPTDTPVAVEPAPVASATAEAVAPQSAPQTSATRAPRATTAPAPSATPTPSPTPEAVAPAPTAEPSATVRAFDSTQLDTFAERGASPQDQRIAAEALSGSRLSSTQQDLPGLGVIVGLSASAALLLGGAAAVVGRGGDRRPRHAR